MVFDEIVFLYATGKLALDNAHSTPEISKLVLEAFEKDHGDDLILKNQQRKKFRRSARLVQP